LFFDAVAHVFATIARRQSLVFYADDLHWADRGTLWLLGHCCDSCVRSAVLIVGAYRKQNSIELTRCQVDGRLEP